MSNDIAFMTLVTMYSTLLKVGFELLISLILSVAGKNLFREVDK